MRIQQKVAAAAVLLAASTGYAEILGTAAAVRSNNSLIVDIQVTTGGGAAQIVVTYQAAGVDPLVSRPTPVSSTGLTTITIGRLRANRTYTYNVRAIDDHGGRSGTAGGSFTTGPLPASLLLDTFTLAGRTTVPLVILPIVQPNFRGYAAFDLHSSDAPQIVWYYSNPPSNASGIEQVDTVAALVRERNGNLLFSDGGTGAGPLAADSFYREISARRSPGCPKPGRLRCDATRSLP